MDKNKKFYTKSPQTVEGDRLAAWADIETTHSEAKVPIPSEQCVVEAKEWVDNVQK